MRTSVQRPRLAEAIEPRFNFALNRQVCWRDKRLFLSALQTRVGHRGMSQMCQQVTWTSYVGRETLTDPLPVRCD
jgi:hypothetical protein